MKLPPKNKYKLHAEYLGKWFLKFTRIKQLHLVKSCKREKGHKNNIPMFVGKITHNIIKLRIINL